MPIIQSLSPFPFDLEFDQELYFGDMGLENTIELALGAWSKTEATSPFQDNIDYILRISSSTSSLLALFDLA